MTLVEDYIHFSLENNYILEELKNKVTLTYDLLEPVIDVLNYMIKQNMKIEGESTQDVEDVFSIGFRYLYASIDHIKRILNENFDEDMEEFLSYDQNMYLYLRVDELDTLFDESNELLSSLLDQLQSTFTYRKHLDKTIVETIENELEKAQNQLDDQTTPDLFIDFADFLGIDII